MLVAGKFGLRNFPVQQWITLAPQGHIGFVEQVMPNEVGRVPARRALLDQIVSAAKPEVFEARLTVQRLPGQRNAGGGLLNRAAQLMEQRQLIGLAASQHQIARLRFRFEGRARPEQALDARDNNVNGGRQLGRLGSRHQALTGAHKELVMKQLAQICERVTDRRWRTS